MRTAFVTTATLGAAAAFTPQQRPPMQSPLAPLPPQTPQPRGAMPAALTPQRRNPLRVVAGEIGHLASTVVKLIVAAPRATAGGVERLAGAIGDARKRRAAAAYVDACLEEAPRPPPPQAVAAFKPPVQPMYGLSPVALRAVNAGRAVATPAGLSASSRPPSALDAAMGSRARASGIPAQPVAYPAPAVSVSSSPPSVLDAAMGARQAVPFNAAPPKALSRSSAPPSVLDAALGSRDRAAIATSGAAPPPAAVAASGAAPPPAAKGRDDYAQAAIKQMQQRATDMDEVAARRRQREREAAAAWTSQREHDVTNAQRAAAATRAATRPVVVVDRVAPPRAPMPLVDRRVVATAPQYAAPPVPLVDRRVATATTEYAAPPVVDAAPPVVDAPAPEAPSATLALSAGGSGIAASLFAQLGGAFLVFMAVMSAPSFSGQMACVAASVVGYQLRALQAFFGVET